jgi:methionine-rich copper-binding protein CopC
MKSILYPLIALAALFPVVGLAHTHLVRSSPADKSVMEKSPPAATLVFAEAVTMTAIKIKPADGDEIVLKPLPTGAKTEMSVAMPTLRVGKYEMRWRALSDDGHVVSGVVHFAIANKDGR